MDRQGVGGRLFLLPQMLEEACIAKQVARSPKCPDVIVTTYTLGGAAWMAQGAEEKRQLEQKREAKLTLAQSVVGKVKPFCKFRDSPLESIADPSLVDSSTKFLGGSFRQMRSEPRLAKVFEESDRSCFCSDDDGAYLEVDLGASCRVTYVSMQGRFPPIDHVDRASGTRVVNEASKMFRNWVTSYDLSFRVVGGHDWITLGRFKGNDDMMTEVAHELASVATSTPECRYLRFKPVAYHGQPAFRVGIYGYRLDKKALQKRSEVHSEEVVEYTICSMKPDVNMRRVHCSYGGCRFGCAKCSKRRGLCKADPESAPGARRKRLVAGMVQEVRTLGAGFRGDIPEDDDEDEVAAAPVKAKPQKTPGADGAAAAAGATADAAADGAASFAPPPRPTLARRRSFSDPDLGASRPPSSSGDGSYAMVEHEALDAVMQWDADDWVLM